MEVITDGGEHGVDGIAGAVSEMIAAHAVLGLEMADHRFDGGAPLEFAFDLGRDAALLTCGKNPHMGISKSRGKKSLVHELKLRCLFRYPRSKPDSVIWLFLARSTSHPVVAQSNCTNIPLAAGGAQEDETILNCGFSGHGFQRFVYQDPPGLIRSWKI